MLPWQGLFQLFNKTHEIQRLSSYTYLNVARATWALLKITDSVTLQPFEAFELSFRQSAGNCGQIGGSAMERSAFAVIDWA